MRIPQFRTKLFHSEKRNDGGKCRQTDKTRLIVAFHSFTKATKMKSYILKETLKLITAVDKKKIWY